MKLIEKYKEKLGLLIIAGLLLIPLKILLGIILEPVLSKIWVDSKNYITDFIKDVVTISIPVYILVLFFVAYFLLHWGYSFAKVKRSGLQIIKAKYKTDQSSFDITRELNDAILDNKLRIILSNNIAGDPHYGVRKKGEVEYKYNGTRQTRAYIEGETIELP